MNIALLLPYAVKAIAGFNVKDDMDANPDVINRPFWLSGRFIGMAMTTVFGGIAVNIGMDLNASIESVTGLVNLVYENQALLASVGCMLAGIGRGLLGFIQRKK